MAKKTDEEKTWENLKKEYLTPEQKIAIISDLNTTRSNEQWKEMLKQLEEYWDSKK